MESNNQVNLATHYRPMNFEGVVGQETPVAVLKRIALSNGIAARAVFIKGAYGSGKSTLARIFGRAMNCTNLKKNGDVCNECDNCKDTLTKNTQLYYEFDSSVAGNIESIRNLESLFSVTPKGRRTVVFDEVHACSKQALNALLKIVEEGVKDTIFVFCSTEDILSTLKSRSVVLDVNTIPLNLIAKRVEEVAEDRCIEITPEDVTTIALKSGGHMRDALSTLQLYEMCGTDALSSSYSLIKEFIGLLAKKDVSAIPMIEEILKYNIVDVRNSIYAYIKSLFVAESGTPEHTLAKTNIHTAMFSFFFAPVAQQALKDESGVEILLRAFASKIIK